MRDGSERDVLHKSVFGRQSKNRLSPFLNKMGLSQLMMEKRCVVMGASKRDGRQQLRLKGERFLTFAQCLIGIAKLP